MDYEAMQECFKDRINTVTERELWNLWVAKDEDYRLMKTMALLGWALAVTSPLVFIFW